MTATFSPVEGVSPRGLARFLLAFSEPDGECLIWQGAVRHGRGWMAVDGRQQRVQLVAWALSRGEPIRRRHVGSSCGSGLCIRPDHLQVAVRDYSPRWVYI